MNRKFWVLAVCLALLMALLTACGGSSSASAPAAGAVQHNTAEDYLMDMAPMEEGAETESYDADSGAFTGESVAKTAQNAVNRKIIWTVEMTVETLEFDPFLTELDRVIAEYGGYLEASSISGRAYDETNNRYGDLTIRVRSDKLEDFLQQVGQIGNVTYTNKYSEDVTLDYTDIESRITTLQIEMDRLTELLEQAEDLESILQIEGRLSEVRYQLETYTSSKNRYDSLIDYSTVYLNVWEVRRVTTVHDQSIGQRIAAGWSDTVYDIRTGLVDFFVWFVVNLPYILIWLLFVGVILWIILRSVKKSRQKRAMMPPPMMPPSPPMGNPPTGPIPPAGK